MNSASQTLAMPEEALAAAATTKAIEAPEKLRRDIPLGANALRTVQNAKKNIESILRGEDRRRFLVVCGPCSIDDVNAALVYGERLRRLAEEVKERVVLVMRTYFEKPRSVVGWKGLMYDPLGESESSPMGGMAIARRLTARLNENGLPCATEFLNPLLALYLEDGIAYGSIGSRTVESQIHRELASRLDLPVGMKNAMDGNAASALNAVRSAASAHSFFAQDLGGRPCLVETEGNALSHVILRGGSSGPNFDEANVAQVVEEGRALGLERPVVIDCSHGNSSKDHRRQSLALAEIARQWKAGQKGIAGLMLESNLIEGRQDALAGEARRFGQSITDACIGWKETETLIRRLASEL